VRYAGILIILTAICLSILSKASYGFSKGDVYNMEAQNIVNTADLIIKAEHAYSANDGGFTGLLNLEQTNPPYLGPIPIYNYDGDGCVIKILAGNNVYICVDIQSYTLNILMPGNLVYSNIVSLEISKGITGKTGQISNYGSMADIAFNLVNNPPSFSSDSSNPEAVSSKVSVLTSPDANGGISYINTENGNDFISKAVQAVIGYFAAALSFF
jgi:hypothetical protein